MRTSAALLLSGAAMLAAPAGPAQAAGQRHYTITPAEMIGVYGTYSLSNGDQLTLSRAQRRYWAEMKSTGRIELVPVGSIVFVDTSGSMRFRFEPLPFTTQVRIEGLGGPPAPPLDGQSGSGIERKFSE